MNIYKFNNHLYSFDIYEAKVTNHKKANKILSPDTPFEFEFRSFLWKQESLLTAKGQSPAAVTCLIFLGEN